MQVLQLTTPYSVGGYTYSLLSPIRATGEEADADGNFQKSLVAAIWKDLDTFAAFAKSGGNYLNDSQCRAAGAQVVVIPLPSTYLAAALGTAYATPEGQESAALPTVPSQVGGDGLILQALFWALTSMAQWAGKVVVL